MTFREQFEHLPSIHQVLGTCFLLHFLHEGVHTRTHLTEPHHKAQNTMSGPPSETSSRTSGDAPPEQDHNQEIHEARENATDDPPPDEEPDVQRAHDDHNDRSGEAEIPPIEVMDLLYQEFGSLMVRAPSENDRPSREATAAQILTSRPTGLGANDNFLNRMEAENPAGEVSIHSIRRRRLIGIIEQALEIMEDTDLPP